MIPKKDFVDYGKKLAVDQQERIDHTNCTSGTDTRKRLYVKNTGSAIIAYCHNCGESGYHTESSKLEKNRVPLALKKGEVKEIADKAGLSIALRDQEVRSIVSTELAKQYKEMIYWLPEKLRFLPVSVSLKSNRLVIPISQRTEEGHTTIGWQERKIYDDSRDPNPLKYVTYKIKGTPSWSELWATDDNTDSLVITEDITSARNVYCSADVSTIALMRTSSQQELILHIARHYKRVVIWLDKDKAGIEAARKLEERLKMFVPVLNITNSASGEAKTFDEHNLKRMLNTENGVTWNLLEAYQKKK